MALNEPRIFRRNLKFAVFYDSFAYLLTSTNTVKAQKITNPIGLLCSNVWLRPRLKAIKRHCRYPHLNCSSH